MIKAIIIATVLYFPLRVIASVNSEAFIVHAKFDKFTVLSPKKINKVMRIILHHDTLVKFYAKLVSETGDDIRYISISPQKHKAIEIKNYNGKKYHFYPISPPFQKVVLDIDRRYSEIPEKK